MVSQTVVTPVGQALDLFELLKRHPADRLFVYRSGFLSEASLLGRQSRPAGDLFKSSAKPRGPIFWSDFPGKSDGMPYADLKKRLSSKAGLGLFQQPVK
jgi:hypothetical protein